MGACAGLKEAGVELRLLIADAVVQPITVRGYPKPEIIMPLWIFSTRAVVFGAQLLSAWLEVILLRHHCRINGWRYSQAAENMWMFLTSPHVYHALPAELMMWLQKHCVSSVQQEHTQTLLWAPHPVYLALWAHTALNPVSFFNQAASHV